MNPYIKSVFWLVGCGGLGYMLMEVTKPNAAKIAEIRNSCNREMQTERERKKALFMEKLQEAAHSKPVYLKTREEIAKDNKN